MNWKTSLAVAACFACTLSLSAQKMSVEFAESEIADFDIEKRIFAENILRLRVRNEPSLNVL